MSAPMVLGVGTLKAGMGAFNQTWLTGHQLNDVAAVFVQTANQPPSITAGWTEGAISGAVLGIGTPGQAGSTRLTWYWRRANGPSMSAVNVSPNGGDHIVFVMVTLRGCVDTGDPVNISSGGTSGAGTAVIIPGATTTAPDCLILTPVVDATGTFGAGIEGWANGSLANVTEIVDENSGAGVNGGLHIATGEKAVAGTYGQTTAELATPSAQAYASIAFKSAAPSPPPTPPTTRSRVVQTRQAPVRASRW